MLVGDGAEHSDHRMTRGAAPIGGPADVGCCHPQAGGSGTAQGLVAVVRVTQQIPRRAPPSRATLQRRSLSPSAAPSIPRRPSHGGLQVEAAVRFEPMMTLQRVTVTVTQMPPQREDRPMSAQNTPRDPPPSSRSRPRATLVSDESGLTPAEERDGGGGSKWYLWPAGSVRLRHAW